jgi:DNA-binding CsgD family transcriptional regulator
VLRGRGREQATLDRLLAQVRGGRSAVLVVRGPAGIGKSALLRDAAERATGCTVLRAVGVESEMELPFASLHQLCAPLLDDIDELPEPQRDALTGAFGRGPATTLPDRFVVGVALLELLTAAAEERPLLCVVDDAQWLDRSSAQTLGFVARRVRDVPVGLLLGERCDDGQEELAELAGLPALRLAGLGDADARALLASAGADPLDERVRDRIVAEARGNPLALLELPRGLTAARMAGDLDLGLPLPSRIEACYREQVAALPPATQQLMLLAAAEPLGDPTLLWSGAARLGIPVDAIGPAEDAGLVEVGARITFRHPLVRSGVYRSASPQERRAVHAALAEVTDPQRDPDRRAWHRAQATPGPDETVAEELERAADRAAVRGGCPATAAFLERATALTLDPRRRALRALASGHAKFEAGAFDEALAHLTLAESSGLLDPLAAARATLLRGQLAFVAYRIDEAVPLLLDAAERLAPLDPVLARDTYRDAFHAAFTAGRFQDGGTRAVAAAARGTAPPGGGPEDLLIDGMSLMLGDDLDTGARRVRAALASFRATELAVRQEIEWLPTACRMAFNVLDFESWDVLSARLVDRAQEQGAVGVLPIALLLRLLNRLLAGELDVAADLHAEVRSVSDATDRRIIAMYGDVGLAAWTGRVEATEAAIEVATERLADHGVGQLLTSTQWARAVLANALGRFDAARAAAEEAREYPDELGVATLALVELVEAAALGGDRERAASALAELVPLTRASGTDWALGTEAAARALVADEPPEPLFREALRRLRRAGVRAALARTHLHYGEWLRRENRRAASREHLRTAQAMFESMGAAAFADRAGRSLQATGARARRRTADTREDLTAQEAQIAGLASQGLSNPEIGAQLFISPRTVEYHLRKVFMKLGITSRTQLEQALSLARARAGGTVTRSGDDGRPAERLHG